MATKPTEPAPSFLQVYTQVRRDRMKHSFLRQINACVDWRGIRTLLNKKYTKTQNAVGNPAYDALLMFKILLLETWYGLSDYEVEERINDSLLFSEFLGLDLGYPSPDHSTISRFRSELTRLGIMDKLLRELNKQFKKHGISRIDQGAIVDASIVDSPYAPDGSVVIEVAEDREDTRSQDALAQEEAYQYELRSGKPGVDAEARWVRKGKHYRYGYKKHVLTDEQGLVEALITTPANCADTVALPALIEQSELSSGVSVLADKGYCSKKNSECLAGHGLVDGIMLKAIRGKTLNESQKAFNRVISKTRCLIERTFGSIRRWFLGGRCRYRGLERTHTQNILEAMAYNLKQPNKHKIPDLVAHCSQDRGKGGRIPKLKNTASIGKNTTREN